MQNETHDSKATKSKDDIPPCLKKLEKQGWEIFRRKKVFSRRKK